MFILVFTLLIEAIILIVLIKRLIKSRKQTLYSYKNAELLGGIIFMVFVAIVTFFVGASSLNPKEDVFLNLSGTMAVIGQLFNLCILPLLIVIFGFIVFSNIALIINTGFSVYKLLGVIIGSFLIGCSILNIYVWDYIYQNITMPLLFKGQLWVIIVDVAIPLFFSSVICYLESLMLGVMIYGYKASKNKPKHDKDIIIILGCGLKPDGTPSQLLQRRIDCALQFADEQYKDTGKEVIFIPSGGKGEDEVIAEAESMRNYLLKKGIPDKRIKIENKSKTTLENLRFSKEIIDTINPEANVLVCTNNFHVYRGCIYARYVGLECEGIGSKTKWYYWPNAFLREFVALLAATLRRHIYMDIFLFLMSIVIGYVYYLAIMR